MTDFGQNLVPAAHASRHENGGADEINVSGLTGIKKWVSRGDPASFDWFKESFSLTSGWLDLPLSNIIPENTLLVGFRVTCTAESTGAYFRLRTNGHSQFANKAELYVVVAGIQNWGDLFVTADASRKVEYIGSGAHVYTYLNVVVFGWMV